MFHIERGTRHCPIRAQDLQHAQLKGSGRLIGTTTPAGRGEVKGSKRDRFFPSRVAVAKPRPPASSQSVRAKSCRKDGRRF